MNIIEFKILGSCNPKFLTVIHASIPDAMPVCVIEATMAFIFNQLVSIFSLYVTVLIVATGISIVESIWKVNRALLRSSSCNLEFLFEPVLKYINLSLRNILFERNKQCANHIPYLLLLQYSVSFLDYTRNIPNSQLVRSWTSTQHHLDSRNLTYRTVLLPNHSPVCILCLVSDLRGVWIHTLYLIYSTKYRVLLPFLYILFLSTLQIRQNVKYVKESGQAIQAMIGMKMEKDEHCRISYLCKAGNCRRSPRPSRLHFGAYQGNAGL